MPTPFYHLSVAEDLLRSPELSSEVTGFLKEQQPAFFLGNTAPDVQTVSGQERQATHFFNLPIRPGTQPAWERIQVVNPGLSDASHLPQDQAAFLAGYLCHLQADWMWVRQIFSPTFGPSSDWSTFRDRLYLHNVLRAYLDLKIMAGIEPGMDQDLEGAIPDHWLPFVEDAYLCQWRDFLVQQLQPGSNTQTVEVFSTRQGIPAEAYYRLIESENRLDEEIFVHLPRPTLESYRQHLLEENGRLLQAYLLGR